jgi:alpha/beta superfamily hydrolase
MENKFMEAFPIIETNLILPGPAGDLEAIAVPADENNQKLIIAIICHPHPLYGGTMNNKVVTTLARTFKDLGLRTVRFNFRGVGKSSGSFGDGIGETEDLLAVIDWVKKTCPEYILWLAGFSFGGFIAARVAARYSNENAKDTYVAQLVTVAPQVSRFKDTNLTRITVPWVLVQGEQDEVVSPEETFAWIETINPKPYLIRMPGAGHFFHGQLLVLRQRLIDYFVSQVFS